MEKAIKDLNEEMTYNHLPYGIRFFMFLKRMRFRFFLVASLVALFNYWGNLLGICSARIERVFKKYKKRWIYKYNRSALEYESAIETKYEPQHMSRPSTEKLSQLFVRIDREMKDYGFSRQLVADVLIRMNLMDRQKDLPKFLDESGYSQIQSKKLNSMSLKEYLTVLEKKFVDQASKDDPKIELQLIDQFIKFVDEEKTTFMDRTIEDIKDANMTPYEFNLRKKEREAAAMKQQEAADQDHAANPPQE